MCCPQTGGVTGGNNAYPNYNNMNGYYGGTQSPLFFQFSSVQPQLYPQYPYAYGNVYSSKLVAAPNTQIDHETFVFPTFELDRCGASNSTKTKIVGGMEAQMGSHPWIAALIYNDPEGIRYHCAGSLISANHVITSAHCVTSTLYVLFYLSLSLSYTI